MHHFQAWGGPSKSSNDSSKAKEGSSRTGRSAYVKNDDRPNQRSGLGALSFYMYGVNMIQFGNSLRYLPSSSHSKGNRIGLCCVLYLLRFAGIDKLGTLSYIFANLVGYMIYLVSAPDTVRVHDTPHNAGRQR